MNTAPASPPSPPASQSIWYVLGAGSLGGLWAARLYGAGLPVCLILRDQVRLAAYQEASGLSLTSAERAVSLPIPACTLADAPPIRRLLLACKAYDAVPAALDLKPYVQTGADVLLLQNGLGSQHAVASVLDHAHCLAVSSTEGAFRRSAFYIQAAGAGQNWIGALTHHESSPSWLKELDAANIPNAWTDDIATRLWRKLALNCAINPLTVLHDCTNGQLATSTDELEPVCTELSVLLNANGVPGTPEDLLAETQRVITATAHNLSSMLQDVRAARRTEIAYLLGYACTDAQRRHLALPALQNLHERLRHHLAVRGLPVD